MPIYEYACKECEKEFSKLQFNSNEKVECPSCGSEKVERQISTLGGIGGSSGANQAGSCGGSGFS